MSLASTAPVPKLAEPFEPSTGDSTPRQTPVDADEKQKKKRSLFGFGKKKTEESVVKSLTSSTSEQTRDTARDTAPVSRKTTASPIRTDRMMPSSPGRSPGRGLSQSPRLASPAGSQIFERDVQESSTVLMPNSPAIPSHIATENYIPPVLDASSEAITDGRIDPDSVEIITHASHQPASVTVTGVGQEPSWADELAAFVAEKDFHQRLPAADSASNYGSFDTTDVRRLSFISFADVVQAEQAGHAGLGGPGSRDSMHLAGLTSLTSMSGHRSPSPIRSPVSSAGGPGTSPPTSKSGSVKGLEMSPSRKPLGSPASTHFGHGIGLLPPASPTVSGELAIETMSQALRRTGSGDLSGVRSLPTSPI
ncbi:hypothetical protein QBC46DRAFT_6815 [Diplogelasinospora grovesii]|uniref:Uncharacterized protein n=1 Tax=Diplogelasinospora grovesii TaxID=303347 RepID=A0AAN6NE29_9PEZI|nr:hypothetical protein QBC46DRAFT_6815 [Diplogelasinospora grovesii]